MKLKIRVFTLALLILALSSSFVWALTYEVLTLEDMTKKAEAILIAECVEKKSEFIAGHFETKVKLKVSEYLKGNLGAELTLTVLGGEISEPIPMGQYVSGMPQFIRGEEVLLFLSTIQLGEQQKKMAELEKRSLPEGWKKSLRRSTLLTSPQVVGLWQGKFTILTDPGTGEKRVTRFRLEDVGFAHNDKVAQKLYALIAKTQKQSPERAKELEEQVKNILGARGESLNQEKQEKDSKGYMVAVRPSAGAGSKEKFLVKDVKVEDLQREKEGRKATGEIELTQRQEISDLTSALPNFNDLQKLDEIKEKIKSALLTK